jgi:hypothetical protein
LFKNSFTYKGKRAEVRRWYSAVGIRRAIHLNVELEIFKCVARDQIGPGGLIDQATILHLPIIAIFGIVEFPAGKIHAIE